MGNLKERYLENLANNGYSEGTIRNYKYIIAGKIAQQAEEDFGKDIYEFTYEECIDLLKRFNNRSLDIVAVNKSALESYIDFAIQEGYVPSRINYFTGLQRSDLEIFVDKNAIKNRYLTYDELLELENMCNNAQDSVIYRLLFIGVRGQQCEEMLNLKVSDVFKDHIKLPDRDIPIDEYTYDLIQEAINQKTYLKNNGDVSPTNKSGSTVELKESEYVLRASGSTKEGQISYTALRVRFDKIRRFWDNPYLNMRNVWFSGMIHELKNIKQATGEITKEDLIKVHKQFGYNEAYIFKTLTEIEKYL